MSTPSSFTAESGDGSTHAATLACVSELSDVIKNINKTEHLRLCGATKAFFQKVRIASSEKATLEDVATTCNQLIAFCPLPPKLSSQFTTLHQRAADNLFRKVGATMREESPEESVRENCRKLIGFVKDHFVRQVA